MSGDDQQFLRARAVSEVEEVLGLQQRLDAKKAECIQLQATLAQVSARKLAARQVGLLGIKTAKEHMEKLRSELLAAKRWIGMQQSPEAKADESGEVDEETLRPAAPNDGLSEEEKMRQRRLQVQVRELQHVLARCKHEFELHEAKRPKQEYEIVALKAELTHTLDIWASTQHAVKHHEIEREFQRLDHGPSMDGSVDPHHVSLHGGGHGSIEAHAERRVREKVEDRNINLSGKAKRLTGVVAAQQLLIQRLQKQVLYEEHLLEFKDRQLLHDDQDISQLRSVVRKHSDAYIAGRLGISPTIPVRRSASAPRLPAI